MTGPLEIESQTQATLTIDAKTPPSGVTGARLELQRDGVLRYVLCTLQEDADNFVIHGRTDAGVGTNYLHLDRTNGRLTLTGPSGDHYLALDTTDTSADRYTGLRIYKNGVTRWIVGKNSDAETGSNAGSNFIIRRYSDAGSTLDNAVIVKRNTGDVEIANNIDINGGNLNICDSSGALFGSIQAYSSSNVIYFTKAVRFSDAYYLRSQYTYDTTSANAQNVYISSGGQFYRSTSSMRTKHDIAAVDGQPVAEVPYDRTAKQQPVNAIDPTSILGVQPVTYVSDSLVDGLKHRLGLLTENVQTHAPWAVNGDTPDWNVITASLLHVVKAQQQHIDTLEARITALEEKA